MKTIRFLTLAIALGILPATFSGCNSTPSQRVVQVQTLTAVGTAAKTSMQAATSMLKQGQITVAQWQVIANAYDLKFQPAFAIAVSAARSDLSSVASPDLIALAGQLATLVAQLTAK